MASITLDGVSKVFPDGTKAVWDMHLQVDNRPMLHTQGHIVVAANMLFIGPHFRVDANSALDDGLLDLVVYAELSKLDLLGTVISAATGGAEDVRIRHDRVRRVVVETNPAMPVILDGFPMEMKGPLRLSVRRRALNIIAAPDGPAQPGQPSAPEQTPAGRAPDTERAPA